MLHTIFELGNSDFHSNFTAFTADTAIQAMEKMRYTLALSNGAAASAVIKVTPTGETVYMDVAGTTYATDNRSERK